MKLSKVHEIGYIIKGETQVLFCSVTVKTRKFLQEKVNTKESDGLRGRFQGSQWCPRQDWAEWSSLRHASLAMAVGRAQAADTGRVGGAQTVTLVAHA